DGRVLAGCRRRQVERVAARGGRNGLDDLHVPGAAADVAAERLDDRLAIVGPAAVEVGLGGEQEPRCAEAALGGVVVDERLLYGREAHGCSETLDGGDLGPVQVADRKEAGAPGAAVDENRARPAASLLAAGLRSGDAELLAQHEEQRRRRRAPDLPHGAVDDDLHVASSSRTRTRCTRIGSVCSRYQAEASASSRRSTSPSAARPACSGSAAAASADGSRWPHEPTPVAASRNLPPGVRTPETARAV